SPRQPPSTSTPRSNSRRSGMLVLAAGRLGLRERGVRIAQPRLVGRARARVEVLEQGVGAVARARLGDAARQVDEVAELDRLRRARLLAGGLGVAVLELAAAQARVDLGRAQALHAVGALLHHAARAHGHVRVVGELEDTRRVFRVVEEVEAPHLVRAVVRAVARADAAVVDHRVQAFRVVHGGRDRADLLARGVLALHAGHRLERGARVGGLAGEVGVDAQPRHLAAAPHLVLADHRDVVLALAGDGAGVAAGAGVEVD